MQISVKKSMLKLGAAAMHGTGALRILQRLSKQYEVVHRDDGRFPNLQRVTSSKFAILCYHRIGTGGVPFHSAFDSKAFEKQLQFLSRNYRIISMDQLCRELREGGPAYQCVTLTFDDGYRALYTNAFPVLLKYGIPATVFLTAGAIETGEVSWYDRIFAVAMLSRADTLNLQIPCEQRFPLGRPEDRLQTATSIVTALRRCSNETRLTACADLERKYPLPESQVKGFMLSWSQIREMQAGGIAFGAHTMTHPCVAQLSPLERHRELVEAKQLLEERLQSPIDHFAFPFGQPSDIGAEACALLPACGYRSAVSTVWGVNTRTTNPYLLRRMGGEEPSLSLFALRLRRFFLENHAVPVEMQDLERALSDPGSNHRRGGTQVSSLAKVSHA